MGRRDSTTSDPQVLFAFRQSVDRQLQSQPCNQTHGHTQQLRLTEPVGRTGPMLTTYQTPCIRPNRRASQHDTEHGVDSWHGSIGGRLLTCRRVRQAAARWPTRSRS